MSCENLLKIKTSHWNIESSHWLLDVQFNEDHVTARLGNASSNLSVLSKFALAVKDGLNKIEEEKSNVTKPKKLATKHFLLLTRSTLKIYHHIYSIMRSSNFLHAKKLVISSKNTIFK